MNCINTKSKEFQELLEASKLPSILLEMRVAKWQEQNGLDNFPKVEDIIQSNNVKPGVSELFESNPELASIGTPEQYSQYLNTIFPDSQVKDIVYHHSDTKITEFKKEFPEGYAAKKGISPRAKFFLRKPLKEEFLSRRSYLGQYLINTVNPTVMPVNADRSEKRDSGIKEGIQEALDNGQDGAIFDNIWDNRTWSDVIVVFEPEQIHILGSKQDMEGFKEFVQSQNTQNPNDVNFQKNQTISNEGKIASEKTIRDLAAKIADRIGIPYKIESDRTKEYKGKIENGVAYINLAYATLDTPIHEILGHPIIRVIKGKGISKSEFFIDIDQTFTLNNSKYEEESKFNEYFKDGQEITKEEFEKAKEEALNNDKKTSQLYQNLLKELETGKGKEVLDRIKRDYNVKSTKKVEISLDYFLEQEIKKYQKENNLEGIFEYKDNKYFLNKNGDVKKFGWKEFEEITDKYYTLEEQQEEAIVELLGLMTAEKLDKVKDGKLISLLKRLLKEMKAFMRSLIGQKEVEIDKLPDNMTLGDISDLLAYSNSKLILPGNEVIYTTPDNQQFKTYAEASKHISELVKSVKNVDLDNISIPKIKEIKTAADIPVNNFEIRHDDRHPSYFVKHEGKWFQKVEREREYQDDDGVDYYPISDEKILQYYLNPEIIGVTKISNAKDNLIHEFLTKNKQYEQSKEIIEEWKKVNDIQYNPEEIYSRGQEFVSVVGAYSDFDINLMMQNLLSHIEDNEKAGGKFAISVFTKPVDKQIGHLEGGGGKIKFKIYPQSKDILWAANIDVYSGSVWDASEKVNKDKKSELLGVSYTKYPSLDNINAVQPNLASIVDDLNHHHNELGISLTGNNFRLEYDENIPYTTKKIIDGINKILDQKYGKLVKPEIKTTIEKRRKTYSVYYKGNNNEQFRANSKEEALQFIDKHSKNWKIDSSEYYLKDSYIIEGYEGVQPTQTNETLKESIKAILSKELYKSVKTLVDKSKFPNNKIGDIITYNNIKYEIINEEKDFESINGVYPVNFRLKFVNEKTYTNQALINTKIAALKETAKKYPRSLIRSEVKRINDKYWNRETLFEGDELPFQKIPSVDFTDVTDNNQESIFETQYKKAEDTKDNSFNQNKNLLFGEKEVTDTLHVNEILDNMIKSQDLEMSPEFVFILSKAMSVNKLSNAKFKLVTKESFDELASKSAGKGTPVMFYDEATNTISTTVEVLEQISMTDLALSVLHEVAHSTTSHYYSNPNISLQAKELKDLIDAAFQQYKYLADKKNPNGEYSYGFTNEKEFIAELYANPQFRQEIIDLDKGFWRKLIDAIRRTFNLPKTKYNNQLIESALLISTVEQFVENNESSQLVGSAKNNYSSSFNSVDFKKLEDIKNETFDDKLNNLYNVAQDNIDQLLRRAEASAKKHGTKNEKFVDKISLLKEHLTNAELLNKWEGVNSYVDFMIGQIMYIDKKINNGTLNEQLDVIDKLYEYAAASDLIKPLRELFKDERIKTLPEETQDFIKQVNSKLRQFSGIHDDNVAALFSKRKEITKQLLQNPYYSQEVISQFEKELSKEYPQDSKISKKEWVSQQLLGPRAKELEERINKHINELFEGIGTDISKWDKTIYSTLNTGSRLIQLVQKIISSMKLKIDNEVNDFDFQLTDVYNRFVKKHGIKKPSEMFKNILEYDSEGNAYIKGFFNLKFKDKYRNEYIPLLNERNKLIEKYSEEEISLKDMYNFKDYMEISEKINAWRKTNMTKVRIKNEDGTSSLKWQPKVNLYKNDFSKLSQEEKELLILYRNIIKDSDKIHRGKNSLLRNAGTALYFKLPSVSISNMERVIEGKLNVKDTITQKISELTSWRPEEIEQYEKQFNALGEEINSIPVLFRNKIKPEEQSLDIFTLIRLEKYNQINYKNKEANQLILETLNDVAKNKKYLKTEAGTGNAVKNLFGIKSKHVTFEGVESQTHARIKNVIEQALYNKFNEEGFKVLGKDVNKLVQTVNGHVGFLGMTLNYFNAPVNILNGEFQIMLEKIGGNISKNKLTKAHAKYSADLPNIIADISRPNKLSFVNQLNLKFDIFGGLSHNQQEFIKNSFAKAVTNKETLQVLQNGGEHLIQSVLNMALLDSIKVRNKEGLYIDKNGKVVTEENAASILDMISLNEDTKKLEFSEHLEYTDKSTVVKWNNGGLENVRLFIKKKIFDTMGEYDKNFQVDLQRHWYGQLVLMYKKFFIPLGLARYRGGIDKVFKDKENLDPSQMHWNEALQEYEEGFYITFGRYLMSVVNNALTTMIPNLKWQMTSQKWSEMSDYEKGNIKKGMFELGMIVMLHMIIIPLLLGFADDDDELLYLAFLGRRLGQELSQYSDIGDAYKITRNPIASLNLIEDTIAVGKFTLSPGAWFSTTKEGDSRFLKATEKVLIPSAWRQNKSSENMIKYMNRELIVPFEDGYLYKSIFGTE